MYFVFFLFFFYCYVAPAAPAALASLAALVDPAAIAALAVVNLFELTNGFGVMTNVYDEMDLLANLLGILFALSIDLMIKNVLRKSRG